MRIHMTNTFLSLMMLISYPGSVQGQEATEDHKVEYNSKEMEMGNLQQSLRGGREEDAAYNRKLSESVVASFKKDHNLRKDARLNFHPILEDNTIQANGDVYSLDDLEPMNVYTDDATYMEEGDKSDLTLQSTGIFIGTHGSETVFVTKDFGGDIQTIDILGDDGRDVYMAAVAPGIMSTIDKEAVDVNFLNKFDAGSVDDVNSDEEEEAKDKDDRQLADDTLYAAEEVEQFQDERHLQSGCSSYKIIEVAAAFDSTFCARQRGSYNDSKRAVEQAVARASVMYQRQGVCAKIQLSHMEGFCNAGSDPYRAGIRLNNICSSQYGILDYFRDYWNRNRGSVRRATAHLFYGQDVDPSGNTIGCAARDDDILCNKSRAYGVNELSFSSDLQKRATLFAHELGHNVGLRHVSEGRKIMSGGLSSGDLMWTSASIRTIRTNLSRRSCIRDSRSGPTPSPPSPTPPTPSPGTTVEFRNRSNGLCLDLRGAQATNGNYIWFYRCNNTRAQRWTVDSNGYIRSAVNPRKCLVGNRGRSTGGNFFILWDCYSNDRRFQHQVYSNGRIYSKSNRSVCVGPSNYNLSRRRLIGYTSNCRSSSSQWTITRK